MGDQDIRQSSLEYHRAPPAGKVSILPTKQLTNQRDLALAYTPGVAAACDEIKRDPSEARNLTARGNLVECGGLDPLRVRPDGVRAGGVERDEKNRWSWRRRRTWRPAARARKNERENGNEPLHFDDVVVVVPFFFITLTIPGSAMSFSMASISTGAIDDMFS